MYFTFLSLPLLTIMANIMELSAEATNIESKLVRTNRDVDEVGFVSKKQYYQDMLHMYKEIYALKKRVSQLAASGGSHFKSAKGKPDNGLLLAVEKGVAKQNVKVLHKKQMCKYAFGVREDQRCSYTVEANKNTKKACADHAFFSATLMLIEAELNPDENRKSTSNCTKYDIRGGMASSNDTKKPSNGAAAVLPWSLSVKREHGEDEADISGRARVDLATNEVVSRLTNAGIIGDAITSILGHIWQPPRVTDVEMSVRSSGNGPSLAVQLRDSGHPTCNLTIHLLDGSAEKSAVHVHCKMARLLNDLIKKNISIFNTLNIDALYMSQEFQEEVAEDNEESYHVSLFETENLMKLGEPHLLTLAATLTAPYQCGESDKLICILLKLLKVKFLRLSGTMNVAPPELRLEALAGVKHEIVPNFLTIQNFAIFVELPIITSGMSLELAFYDKAANQTVVFKGSVHFTLTTMSLGVSLEMVNKVWQNPFGIDFLSIENTHGTISFSPAEAIVTEVEYGGGVLLGKPPADDTVTDERIAYGGTGKIDVQDIGKNAFSFNANVTMKQLLSFFGIKLSGEAQRFLEAIRIELQASVGDAHPPPGVAAGAAVKETFKDSLKKVKKLLKHQFSCLGRMSFLGETIIMVDIKLSLERIHIYYQFPVIKIASIVQISHSKNVDLGGIVGLFDFEPQKPQDLQLKFNAYVLWGPIAGQIAIQVNATGFYMRASVEFFKIFTASITMQAETGVDSADLSQTDLSKAKFTIIGELTHSLDFKKLTAALRRELSKDMKKRKKDIEQKTSNMRQEMKKCTNGRQAVCDNCKTSKYNACKATAARKRANCGGFWNFGWACKAYVDTEREFCIAGVTIGCTAECVWKDVTSLVCEAAKVVDVELNKIVLHFEELVKATLEQLSDLNLFTIERLGFSGSVSAKLFAAKTSCSIDFSFLTHKHHMELSFDFHLLSAGTGRSRFKALDRHTKRKYVLELRRISKDILVSLERYDEKYEEYLNKTSSIYDQQQIYTVQLSVEDEQKMYLTKLKCEEEGNRTACDTCKQLKFKKCNGEFALEKKNFCNKLIFEKANCIAAAIDEKLACFRNVRLFCEPEIDIENPFKNYINDPNNDGNMHLEANNNKHDKNMIDTANEIEKIKEIIRPSETKKKRKDYNNHAKFNKNEDE